MKEEKIEYDKSFIDLVERLSPVNHRILITKEGAKAVIRSNNEECNFCYIIEAPLKYIGLPVDELGILDFTRFKKFYDSMSTKTTPASLSVMIQEKPLSLDEGSTVKEEASRIVFKNAERSDKLSLSLGDTSLPTFKPGFHELAEHENHVVTVLTEDMINEIQKKISIIGGNYIDVEPKDNVLNLFIYTMQSADTAEYPILLEQPATQEFKSKYNAAIFSLIPKGDYETEIDLNGCIFLKQKRDDEIKLSIMLLSEDTDGGK